MRARIDYITIEESGAFTSGNEFTIRISRDFEPDYPWWHASTEELRRFHAEIGKLLEPIDLATVKPA